MAWARRTVGACGASKRPKGSIMPQAVGRRACDAGMLNTAGMNLFSQTPPHVGGYPQTHRRVRSRCAYVHASWSDVLWWAWPIGRVRPRLYLPHMNNMSWEPWCVAMYSLYKYVNTRYNEESEFKDPLHSRARFLHLFLQTDLSRIVECFIKDYWYFHSWGISVEVCVHV